MSKSLRIWWSWRLPLCRGCDNAQLAEILGITIDQYGFFEAADSELSPVESAMPGVFLAGAALGPNDIPETVAQASGAAAKVLSLFQRARTSTPRKRGDDR